jgi:hypothetical protein
MFEPGRSKYCYPFCKFFRCQRRALIVRGNKRICGLTGDDCDPVHCQFALCGINKLVIPDGICGLWREKQRIRRSRLDISEIEDDTVYKIKGRGDLFF